MKKRRGVVYVNNAATSFPKTPGMAEVVAAALQRIPRESGRSGAGEDDVLFRCRQEIARLINVEDPLRVVFCKNATEALNIAIHGIGLNQDAVVTSAVEHNSVLRPLFLLEKRGVIKTAIIPCDSEGRVKEDEWKAAIENLAPRLVVLNHSSNVTGAVNHAEKLLYLAKKKDCLTILDASQSLGLLDVDAGQLNADILVFTGHKYLLGPAGTGGMYVREGIELEPWLVGGTGVRSDLVDMPPEMPVRLEAGTPAAPLFAGLLHSLKWQSEHRIDIEKMRELISFFKNGFTRMGIQAIEVRGEQTATISFCIPGWKVAEVGYVLDRSFGIICRTGLHCAPLIHPFIKTAPEGSIRVSLSRFNSEEEMTYCLKAINQICREAH